jgi:hypothetical protein
MDWDDVFGTLVGAGVGTALPTIVGQILAARATREARAAEADRAAEERRHRADEARRVREFEALRAQAELARADAVRREERVRLVRADRLATYQRTLEALGAYASVVARGDPARVTEARDRALASVVGILESDVARAAEDCLGALERVADTPAGDPGKRGATAAAIRGELNVLRDRMADRTRFTTVDQEP